MYVLCCDASVAFGIRAIDIKAHRQKRPDVSERIMVRPCQIPIKKQVQAWCLIQSLNSLIVDLIPDKPRSGHQVPQFLS
jgi:hypothetical protein